MVTVIALAAVDGYRTAAARDGQCSMRLTHKTCSLHDTCIDGAVHLQVLEGGILDMAEWGAVVILFVEWILVSTLVEGQLMAVAIKGALERVGIVCTRHIRNADVGVQLHELAVEFVAVSDVISEGIPLVNVIDYVRTGFGAFTREGKTHVVLAVKQNAVLVSLYHAVVLHKTA